MLELFAFISFTLFAFGTIPYIVSVKRGLTNPHIMSIYIFLMLGFLNVASQFAEGASLSLVFPFFTIIVNVTLLIVMQKSEIGAVRPIDVFSMNASVIIVLVWWLTNSAALAILLLTLVNIIAKILVTKKVYEHPYSEPIRTYLFWIGGSFFTMFSVGSLDWVLLLPAFNNIVTLTIIVITMVTLRRSKPVVDNN